MAGSLGVAASVVGIGSGLNSILGGSSGGGGGSTSAGTYDPYGPYRGQAANTLQTLLQDPSQALAQPGYQQMLQQGQQTVNRGMAAAGQLQSGQEQVALQNLGQQQFSSYYNNLLGQYMQLSGASQQPANAALAQQQAANLAQNRGQQSLSNITGGLGGLSSVFGGNQGFGNSGMSSGMSGSYTGNVYDSAGNLASSGNAAPAAATWGSAFGGTGGMGD